MSHLDLEVQGGVIYGAFLLMGEAQAVDPQVLLQFVGAQGLTKVHLGTTLGVATLGAEAGVGVRVRVQALDLF